MVWTGDGHNGEGNGTMTNKYATKCDQCGKRVEAGKGTLHRSALLIKGWMVVCNDTHKTVRQNEASDAMATARAEFEAASVTYEAALIAWRATFGNADAAEQHAINDAVATRARKVKHRAWDKVEKLRWQH